jgi:hypothetical protein
MVTQNVLIIMKKTYAILLVELLATVAIAHIDFSPEVINVTPDNAGKHSITVMFTTATDEWDEVIPNRRYIYITVPVSQTKRPIKEISMRLAAQGRYSYIPLSYTAGTTNANARLTMDVAHIPGSIVYAEYSRPKGDLGVEYRIMLDAFLPKQRGHQIGIGTLITERPSHTTEHTDHNNGGSAVQGW